MSVGKVYLVGAGPGDPGLFTVKGVECLRQADVVLYDRLIDPRLLQHARPDAEAIYVGKSARNHALSQDEINALLLDKALVGKTVVRLKGGDPFVFGRGGEELEGLADAGVPFEVVPGITSAIAALAYAGIPITHREYTSSFAVVTGHEDPTKPDSSIDWAKLATATGTLVLLMGVERLNLITRQLIEHGRSPDTPIALVRWGTWTQQESIEGTLGDIRQRLEGRDFRPPAVIVVGEVVGLRDRLRWFDKRLLFGKRVLVTRAREQASQLAEQLAGLGAQPIEAPAIEIREPEDFGPLDRAIEDLVSYDWVVFTSVNGVESCFRRLAAAGLDARAFAGVEVAAVGPATARALQERGIVPDYLPERFLTAAVAEGLAERDVAGARVLLPRTDLVGEDLAAALMTRGALVDQVVAYRTAQAPLDPEIRVLLAAGKIDIVTFTSSSTVRNLVQALEGEVSLLQGATVASIGPITSRTAREHGLAVDVEAAEHTVPGLVQAIVNYSTNSMPSGGKDLL